jgi:hypothetical protein
LDYQRRRVSVAYATASEFAACDFLPDGVVVPDDVDRLLARASRMIDRALMRAVYDVDESGQPTDTAVIAALADATCAQAAWWLETGDEQGAAAGLNSAGSGGGPYWGGAVARLAPDVETVLRTATDSAGNPLLTGPWQT